VRRLGLVGFGSIAEHGHLPAWRALGVEVTAIADLSPQRLDAARHLLPDTALFDAPLDLIREADIDLLDICTPPGTHAALLLAACARELPDIVCEKPLVLDEETYLAVARARAESGSRIICVNNWAYSDLNGNVRDVLAAGSIGEIRRVLLRIGRPDCALGNAGWQPRWRTDLTHAGGGIILDHGWHQLYLMLGWVRQPLKCVRAVTRTIDRRHKPVEDEAEIDLVFSSAQGRIELAWTANSRENDGYIEGTKGSIAIQDDRIVVQNSLDQLDLPFRSPLSQSSYHPDWFEATFRYNIGDENQVAADHNFSEVGLLVSVICAAYSSAQACGAPCRPALAVCTDTDAGRKDKTEGNHVHSGRGGTTEE